MTGLVPASTGTTPTGSSESTPHRSFLETRHFPSLDGLRCASILAVIAFHCSVCRWGDQGVDMFFTLSGFLITTLLLRESARDGTISLRKFYARRALRIFPLYYAVLLLYVVIIWKREAGTPQGDLFFRNLPCFATYTSNWFMETRNGGAHFWFSWSLATEEQFYLVWPLVVFLAGRRVGIPVAFMVALVVYEETMRFLVGRGTVNLGQTGNAIATSIATPICLGCLLACALHFPATFRRVHAIAARSWSAPLALALLAAALYAGRAFPGVVTHLAMAFLLATVCIREQHPLLPALANPVVRYLGTISYGMYMLHMLSRGVVRVTLNPGPWMLFAATTAVAIAAATLSWFCFEKPFLRLKERFSS